MNPKLKTSYITKGRLWWNCSKFQRFKRSFISCSWYLSVMDCQNWYSSLHHPHLRIKVYGSSNSINLWLVCQSKESSTVISSRNVMVLYENNIYNVHSFHWVARQAILILGFRAAEFHHRPMISSKVNPTIKKVEYRRYKIYSKI